LSSKLLKEEHVLAPSVVTALFSTARTKNIRRRLSWFIFRHKASLCKHPETWGMTAYALLGLANHRKAARWMRNWKSRGDAQPWMLLNLVEALRHLGKTTEAREVGTYALSLTADHSLDLHRMWLALDEAFAGKPEAEELLKGLTPTNFGEMESFALHAALAACAAWKISTEGKTAFDKAREHLREARKISSNFNGNRLQRRLHNRAAALAAQKFGGLFAWVWRYWWVINGFTGWAT
jgi:hypothetical protein